MRKILTLSAGLMAIGMASPVLAQEAAEVADPSANVAYIFNTLLFLIGGFLVMWMAAGFAMLEAGLVRSKNVSMQCLKNIGLYSLAGIMFWVTGYNLMYTDVTSWIGSFGPYGMQAVGEADVDTGYSVASDWFFQMVFCATTASIVSGTIAERVKFWPFMIFVAILTGFLYPITGSWEWGTGWLDQRGFSDFAGSTLVHSVGGWAALAGALIIGPRLGRYVNGKITVMPGSNIPLATLGTFILWLGWFGFNGASQLAMGTVGDVSDVSKIFVNTNMAAAGGVVTAIVLTQILYKKIDVTMALNGALAGLVSITAEPLTPSVPASILIGSVGGLIVVFAVPLLDKLKIDDVVGAIPVHLLAGIWGTLIVAWNTQSEVDGVTLTVAQQLGVQALGVVAIGAFTFVLSAIVWTILKFTIGVRPSEEDERLGMDITEVGVEAYPEFAKG
ncbi:ammonium transporter [Parasphingorhabdus litoris]|uniref:Ammonium transporter n=1 Tax=Parasphingorhabdus litoris TaxID=394733 RepID=A0ABN1B0Q4_9SPHN|nr:ammonium transporter [Parasphingorhabdus litoris]